MNSYFSKESKTAESGGAEAFASTVKDNSQTLVTTQGNVKVAPSPSKSTATLNESTLTAPDGSGTVPSWDATELLSTEEEASSIESPSLQARTLRSLVKKLKDFKSPSLEGSRPSKRVRLTLSSDKPSAFGTSSMGHLDGSKEVKIEGGSPELRTKLKQDETPATSNPTNSTKRTRSVMEEEKGAQTTEFDQNMIAGMIESLIASSSTPKSSKIFTPLKKMQSLLCCKSGATEAIETLQAPRLSKSEEMNVSRNIVELIRSDDEMEQLGEAKRSRLLSAAWDAYKVVSAKTDEELRSNAPEVAEDLDIEDLKKYYAALVLIGVHHEKQKERLLQLTAKVQDMLDASGLRPRA